MLRKVVSNSAIGKKKYVADALTQGDYYYAQRHECTGIWCGLGAQRLGLTGKYRSGDVTPEKFTALVDGGHPTNGDR